jgi:hypothetical protein
VSHGNPIAIVTCKKNLARRQSLLDTWVPLAREAGYVVEFFDGGRLGVPDDYVHLPLKAKAIFKWAHDMGSDHFLKLDDDAYVQVNRLKAVESDYAGVHCPANDLGLPKAHIPNFPAGTFPYDYLSGGAIWFSKKAVQILANTPLNNDFADDRWVGQTLAQNGITRTLLPDFYWYPHVPVGTSYTVIFNVPTPENVRILHRECTPPPVRLPYAENDLITVIIKGRRLRIPRPTHPGKR